MKIQASSAHRILNCPYSLQLEQEIPEGMRNAPVMRASTFGSDMHDIAEKQLEAYISAKKIPNILKMVKTSTSLVSEQDKGFKAVNEYVKYVKKHIRKFENKDCFRFLLKRSINLIMADITWLQRWIA